MNSLRWILSFALFALALAAPTSPGIDQSGVETTATKDIGISGPPPDSRGTLPIFHLAARSANDADDNDNLHQLSNVAELLARRAPAGELVRRTPLFSRTARALVAECNVQLAAIEGYIIQAHQLRDLMTSEGFPPEARQLTVVQLTAARALYQAQVIPLVERIAQQVRRKPWIRSYVAPTVQRARSVGINLDLAIALAPSFGKRSEPSSKFPEGAGPVLAKRAPTSKRVAQFKTSMDKIATGIKTATRSLVVSLDALAVAAEGAPATSPDEDDDVQRQNTLAKGLSTLGQNVRGSDIRYG